MSVWKPYSNWVSSISGLKHYLQCLQRFIACYNSFNSFDYYTINVCDSQIIVAFKCRFLCLCIFKMSGKAGRSSQSCPSRYLSRERWNLPVEIWDVQLAIASRTTKGSKNSGWSALLFGAYAPTFSDLPPFSLKSYRGKALIHHTEFQHSGNGLTWPNFYSSTMLRVNIYGIFAFDLIDLLFIWKNILSDRTDIATMQRLSHHELGDAGVHGNSTFPPFHRVWEIWKQGLLQVGNPW